MGSPAQSWWGANDTPVTSGEKWWGAHDAPVDHGMPEPKTFGDHLLSAASNFWDQVNPMKLMSGAATAVNSPIETLKAIGDKNASLYKEAEDSWNKGDYAAALQHGLNYILNGIPGVGATLDEAGEQAKNGDIGGALGKTAGLAAVLIGGPKAPEAAVNIVRAVPRLVAKPAIAKTLGSAAGAALGHELGIPGGGLVGAIVGREAGGAIADRLAPAAEEAAPFAPMGIDLDEVAKSLTGKSLKNLTPSERETVTTIHGRLQEAALDAQNPPPKPVVIPAQPQPAVVVPSEPPTPFMGAPPEKPPPLPQTTAPVPASPPAPVETPAPTPGSPAPPELPPTPKKPASAAQVDEQSSLAKPETPPESANRSLVALRMADAIERSGVKAADIDMLEDHPEARRTFWDNVGRQPGVSPQKDYSPSDASIQMARDILKERSQAISESLGAERTEPITVAKLMKKAKPRKAAGQ